MTDQIILQSIKTRWQWADEITTAWRDSIAGIIAVGQLLIDAKSDLEHGEFINMVNEDLPFERTTAFRLMTIGKHPFLSNVAHVQHLPASWGTLYEITKLDDSVITEKLESGEISPKTQRKDVTKWLGGKNLGPMMTSHTDEWYTTDDIIFLVKAVMGGIDLDPCSNNHEEPNVPAKNHYTKEDDGLSKDWFGRVYMNPPYGNALPHWIDKMVGEYTKGHMERGIILCPARPDTRWFKALRDFTRCFVFGRVKFKNHENNAENSSPFPTMLVNIGCDEKIFHQVMSGVGDVYRRVEL